MLIKMMHEIKYLKIYKHGFKYMEIMERKQM